MSSKNVSIVYRLALFGLSGSGKTVMLTALSMPHWQSDGYQIAPIQPSEIREVSAADRKKFYEEAWRRIDKAKTALSRGEMPEPSPVAKFHYRFAFTDSLGMTQLEFIDYSGEILDPGLMADEKSIQQALRNVLKEVDGLIILAPASKNKQSADFFEEVHALTTAFQSIAEQRKNTKKHHEAPTPVVILVNKWDALGEIKPSNPALEQQKLAKFLQSDLGIMHRQLWQGLSSAFGRDNVKILPASALGNTERREVQGRVEYFPLHVNPLRSFQLEQGIAWLIRRDQTLEIEHYQEQLREAQKCPLCPNVMAVFQKFLAKNNRLLNFYQKKTEAHKKVKQLVKQAGSLFAMRLTSLIFLTVFSLLAAETALDANKFQSLQTANDSQKTYDWLFAYNESFLHLGHKLFFLNEKMAEAKMQTIAGEVDDLKWNEVMAAKELEDQIRLVTDYLQTMPGGKYVKEAQIVKAQAESDLNKRKAAELSKAAFAEFSTNYQRAMAAEDYAYAGKLLIERTLDDANQAKLAALKAEFSEKIQGLVAAKVLDYLNETPADWDAARAIVRKFREIPIALQGNDGTNWALAQERRIALHQDEALYNAFLMAKDESNGQAYLALPAPTMQREVTQYLNYLKEIRGTLSLNIALNMQWQRGNDNVQLKVTVNGADAFRKFHGRIKRGQSTWDKFTLTGRLIDTMEIQIRAYDTDSTFGTKALGYAQADLALRELISGQVFRLEGSDFTNTATLRITNLPERPTLPTWRR